MHLFIFVDFQDDKDRAEDSKNSLKTKIQNPPPAISPINLARQTLPIAPTIPKHPNLNPKIGNLSNKPKHNNKHQHNKISLHAFDLLFLEPGV